MLDLLQRLVRPQATFTQPATDHGMKATFQIPDDLYRDLKA